MVSAILYDDITTVRRDLLSTFKWAALLGVWLPLACATVNEITPGVRVHVTPQVEPEQTATSAQWIEEIDKVVKTGDWLVVRAYTSADDAVVIATNIPLSHVAVYDAEKDRVIEARWLGVSARPMKEFIDHAHRVLVIRPKWHNEVAAKTAMDFASSLIGSGYDFGGLIGFGTDQRYYCSELAVQIYRESFKAEEHVPRVVEPGQLFLWGKVLFDSCFRN